MFVVVQLYPGHSEKRERASNSCGAAALRCGQSGASRGYCPPQPGHGQKKQRPNRYQLCNYGSTLYTVHTDFSMLLIKGSYALRDLVSNLPCGQQHPAKNLEGDTVVSILNTIHEIITDSPENAKALIQGQAVQKLVAINKSRYINVFQLNF